MTVCAQGQDEGAGGWAVDQLKERLVVFGCNSPVCGLRGLAPRYARFTLAFLPSMMGLGSLQARSAAPRSIMVT